MNRKEPIRDRDPSCRWRTLLKGLTRPSARPPKHSRRVIAALLLLLLSLAAPRPPACRASMVDVYGWGSRATAMGGAFTALADDFSAVYYNPAGLMYPRTLEEPVPGRKGIRFDLGYVYGEPRLWIRDPGKGRALQDYGSTTGPYLGVAVDPVDFHGTFRRKVFAFGLGLYLPADHLLYYGRYFPEERRFPFFYDYAMRFVLIPGIALEPFPGLSLGAGAQVLARLHTDTIGTVYVKLEDLVSPESVLLGHIPLEREQARLGEREDLTLQLAPILGILVRPYARLRLGLVYRGENYLNDFGLTNPVINLGEVLVFEQGYRFQFVRFFTPHQIFLGVAWKPAEALTISVDAGWFDWSDFRDIEARRPDPPFRDTWMPRLGLEVRPADFWCLRTGYFFYRSPVPEQRGRTNFLDNDRHVLSAGGEWIWRDPPGFWNKPVHFAFHLQVHLVAERHYRKADMEDPLFPGYSFGGRILMGGLQVSIPL